MANKEMLVKQAEQVTEHMTESEGAAVKGKETMVALNVKLETTGKPMENVAYD